MAILDKLVSRFQLEREARDAKRRRETVIAQAVQRVLELSAPVMGTFRDCRRELHEPVAAALTHIDETIAAIPGPLPLSPQAWGRHPLLQALFVDAEEVKALLVRDRRLRSFFTRNPAARACALLTASRCERTIFCTAVEGEIVRRDVARTAVEFRDRRLLDPGETPDETRHALRMRALTALVTAVIEPALRQRSLQEELREQQRILSIQLKIKQSRLDRSADGESGATGADPPAILADIDRQIRELSAASIAPQEILTQVAEVLRAPQAVLTVNPVAMRLNWMGVKQCKDSPECDLDIRLVEVELKDHWRRTAVFVDIARPESG